MFGFLGTTEFSEGHPASENLKHCSHQLGVHPDYRNRSIGYRLKLAQRRAVLEQGLQLATWTYDPLLSLNGYFNVRRLGVVCNRYIRDAYGSMRDGLNVGLPSDRFDVDWWVDSSRVIERVEERSRLPELSDYQKQGAVVLNPAHRGEKGLVYPPDHFSSPENTLALVEIPSDFLRLKDIDFELAQVWKFQTREIFESAFAADYKVSDFLFTREREEPRSYYLLARSRAVEGER
ncbi:MAG TPA: hypothetical protein G4O11_09500 [Anaerolineae bacterium]|nr:hypothetical protein [Anaerolineae bacterium]